jgi:hypothetical protein
MNEIVPTKSELAESLVTELNTLHERACQLDDDIKRQFAEKLQVVRQIADLLETARSNLWGAKYEAFIRHLNFSQPVLKSYQVISRRARKDPQMVLKWRDLEDFEKRRETAAALTQANPPARLRDPKNYFADISRYLQKILVSWSKAQNARPPSRWETLQLETFALELKPLVDLFAKIKKELAQRG